MTRRRLVSNGRYVVKLEYGQLFSAIACLPMTGPRKDGAKIAGLLYKTDSFSQLAVVH